MDAVLYAEVYLICIIFTGILLFWPGHKDTQSTMELWMRRMLNCFIINFTSNFLFTVFNRIVVIEGAAIPLSYGLKTLYFVTLVMGVYCWCGYAEALQHSKIFEDRQQRVKVLVPLIIGLAMPLINLFTHWMFDFDNGGAYNRHFLYQAELAFLFVMSSVCGVRLLRFMRREADPYERTHMGVTACFPLCILASLILSVMGESVPVICVTVMMELQCIYLGTTKHQISMDKLTQINNRQNLIGFMNYKLKNHGGDLYLLILDLDDFKQINDTWGHLEGDRALVDVAKVLKRCCGSMPGRPYIARYGGDEFMIVLDGDETTVLDLCSRIDSELNALNKHSKTYMLHLSHGYSRWQSGMDHKALIEAADKELYRYKETSKRLRGARQLAH